MSKDKMVIELEKKPLDKCIIFIVKKMDSAFNKAEYYKKLGSDELIVQEVLKNNLVGAAYKECFELLCATFKKIKGDYLPKEAKITEGNLNIKTKKP